jgi:hypothetical protein
MILIAKRTVTVLAALVLVFGLASEAGATAYAYSFMAVTNLSVTFGPSQPFSCPTNCFFTSTTTASLTGFAPASNTASSFSAGTVVDPAEAFVGLGGPNPGPNSFGPVGAAGPSYARGDSILSSTIVNTNPGPATGSFSMVGETAVVPNLTGTGSATNDQTWGLTTFHLTAGNTASISFDIDALVLTTNTAAGEGSNAHLGFLFALQGIGTNAPTDINCSLGLSSSQVGAGTQSQDEASFSAPGCAGGGFLNTDNGNGTRHITFLMQVGTTGDYKFKIGADTPVDAVASTVPEPMSLMLLGVGLTVSAAVGIRRRRTTKAGAEV